MNAVLQCVSSQASGTTDFIKSAVAILAAPLSLVTFYFGYRQREYERGRSYYQTVVVDVLLPDILTTFDEQSVSLLDAGREAQKGAASSRKTVPRSCNIALASFADSLFKLQDRIIQRVSIFDEHLVEQIRDRFLRTQDDLTSWFEDVGLHRRREIHEIDDVLRQHERNLVRLLYKGGIRSFKA